MSRRQPPHAAGSVIYALFVIASITAAAQWVAAHITFILTLILVGLVIALGYWVIRYMREQDQARAAEEAAIAYRADLQDWQVATGNPAGTYGYDMPRQ